MNYDQTPLPFNAMRLMAYVEANGPTERSRLLVAVLLASVHPDFAVSIATARFLGEDLRSMVAVYILDVLLVGLSDNERRAIYLWARRWIRDVLDHCGAGEH